MSDYGYVFITGISRTGSKMRQRILDNDQSDIAIAPEIAFQRGRALDVLDLYAKHEELTTEDQIRRFSDELWDGAVESTFWKWLRQDLIQIEKESFRQRLAQSDRTPRAVLQTILDLFAESRGKRRSGAKFPVDSDRASMLLDWFPNARVIHITRDPRATAASHAYNYIERVQNGERVPIPGLRRKIKLPRFPTLLVLRKLMILHVIRNFNRDARMYDSLESDPRCYLSRFEELVREPREFCKELCTFVDIPFNDAMLSPQVSGSSYGQTEKKTGLDSEKLARWKEVISPLDARMILFATRRYLPVMGY